MGAIAKTASAVSSDILLMLLNSFQEGHGAVDAIFFFFIRG